MLKCVLVTYLLLWYDCLTYTSEKRQALFGLTVLHRVLDGVESEAGADHTVANVKKQRAKNIKFLTDVAEGFLGDSRFQQVDN